MTTGPIVSNSSPLIILERIERLDIVRRLLKTVVIPPAVATEVFSDSDPPGWIRVVALSTEVDATLSTTLGRGEREVIALAREIEARLVILDDLPARRVARLQGLPIVGTVGLVLAAKNAGIIEVIAPVLEQCADAGFHLSRAVRAAVLKAAGEV